MSKTEDNNLKSFPLFIQQLEAGGLHEDISEKMRECVSEIADACLDRGGTHKASLTLKLDFSMNQKDRIVEVSADLQTKLPKTPRGRAGMYFCDGDGNLTRQDPRQRSFDEVLNARIKKENQI